MRRCLSKFLTAAGAAKCEDVPMTVVIEGPRSTRSADIMYLLPAARRVDRALRDSECRPTNCFKHCPPPSIPPTPLGRITFYNEAAAALWGCRPTSARANGAARGAFIGRMAGRCRTGSAPWPSRLKNNGRSTARRRWPSGPTAREFRFLPIQRRYGTTPADDRRGEYFDRYHRTQGGRAASRSGLPRSSTPRTTRF